MKKIVGLVMSVLLLIWGCYIWYKADKEIAWFLLGIVGIQWQVGGTWQKLARRVVAVLSICACCFFYSGFSWWLLLSLACYFGYASLPFTLIGNSVHDSWINWVWIWVSAALAGACAITVGLMTNQVLLASLLAIIPFVGLGTVWTLSNIKQTAKAFPWKLCEFLCGVLISVPVCYLLSL
jgi:hypothetical protein